MLIQDFQLFLVLLFLVEEDYPRLIDFHLSQRISRLTLFFLNA